MKKKLKNLKAKKSSVVIFLIMFLELEIWHLKKFPYTLYEVFYFEFFQKFFINHIIQHKIFCSNF